MKSTELIQGEWYTVFDAGDEWLFKFEHIRNRGNVYYSKISTPIDNYITRGIDLVIRGDVVNNFIFLEADMNLVYKLFPEELPYKQLSETINYEIF